jgi:competence protein ComEC
LACAYFIFSYDYWADKNSFKIFFFNVGQGDSTLIVTPTGKTILIDGGPDQKVLKELGLVLPFWQRHIDLVIISHAHDDHIGGLIEIIRRYDIGNVVYNNLNFKTPMLETLKEEIKEKNIKMVAAKTGLSFSFSNNCSFDILKASKESALAENDYSIVSDFYCLGKKILLTGDAGVMIEKELLADGIDLKSDIIKISHHGSNSASSEKFLKAVNPISTVISVGAGNRFNHPSTLILDRLKKMGVDIYRTDQLGTIKIFANNKTIKVGN